LRNQTIFVEHIPNPTKVAKKIIKKKNYPGQLSASLNTNIETNGLYNWI